MQKLRHTHAQGPAIDEEVRQALSETDRAFERAIAAGDPEGAARGVYSEDATILPPGAEMVRGREAIARFWRDAASAMGLQAVALETVELTRAGDFVHQIGRAVLTVGGEEVRGKYVVVWKQEDGRWKWHVDIWNTDS